MSDERAARAIADVSAGIILATVTIAAPAERIFRALTDPAELPKWWGADDMYRTTTHSADLRPGGAWRSEGKGADGTPFFVEGEYLEVDPPHRLVMTWKAPWDGGKLTTVTYTLEPIEEGTKLTLRHEGFAGRADSCRSHGNGWPRVFGWLKSHLEPKRSAEKKFFHVRLLPPRPDFAMTMQADERAIMTEHVGYWRQMLADGKAVLFGPVADPAGAWGLGILKAEDEAAVKALTDADPTIRSGRGFSFEVRPMLDAVTA
jgi:uncharacterized protein YndB with AHSA1/START domain